MLAAKRRQQILEYLEKNQTATTHTLCQLTGASLATIRRDLTFLEEAGQLPERVPYEKLVTKEFSQKAAE